MTGGENTPQARFTLLRSLRAAWGDSGGRVDLPWPEHPLGEALVDDGLARWPVMGGIIEITSQGIRVVEEAEAHPTDAAYPFPSLHDMGLWEPPAPAARDEYRWLDIEIRPDTAIENVYDWDRIIRGLARRRGYGIPRDLYTRRGRLETQLGIPASDDEDGDNVRARRFEAEALDLLHGQLDQDDEDAVAVALRRIELEEAADALELAVRDLEDLAENSKIVRVVRAAKKIIGLARE